jgi:4-hydroxy-3-methylbut-2-enyl diphosphate reductase
MGVRRAVALALKAAASSPKVCTLGHLIHNPQALESLREQGVYALEWEGGIPRSLKDTALVIRAHGIRPDLERRLARQGALLVDATCPNVKRSQLKAKSLAERGYQVFLAGEKRHGEIIGIQGYAPACFTVETCDEAAAAARGLCAAAAPPGKSALIGQTTLSPEAYHAIAESIRQVIPDLAVIDTICKATRERQAALRALCRGVDAVVVAGGRESANTRGLLACAGGKPAWLVETEADIPAEIARFRTVGLSAGASTPDAVIDEIERALQSR